MSVEPADESLFMIVDPVTREALRSGPDPLTDGPLFFSSREKAEAHAQHLRLEEFELHSLPAGVLPRMKGKPHFLDGTAHVARTARPRASTSSRGPRPT